MDGQQHHLGVHKLRFSCLNLFYIVLLYQQSSSETPNTLRRYYNHRNSSDGGAYNASRLQHTAAPFACCYFMTSHHLVMDILYLSTFVTFRACDLPSTPVIAVPALHCLLCVSLPRIIHLVIRSEVL